MTVVSVPNCTDDAAGLTVLHFACMSYTVLQHIVKSTHGRLNKLAKVALNECFQKEQHCLAAGDLHEGVMLASFVTPCPLSLWAVQYITRLLVKLTPKGVLFSFLSFFLLSQ